MKISNILSFSPVFMLFIKLIGAENAYQCLTRNYIKPVKGDKIFDVGCGLAGIRNYFPDEVEYHGFDISASYIEKARKSQAAKAIFHNSLFSAETSASLGLCDIGMAIALLHHLSDDEALELLRLAFNTLKPGGRFITLDGCYTEKQSPVTQYLLSNDRGKFVRTEAGYKNLIQSVFKDFRYDIRHDLLRIPYTHIIFECRKPL